MRLAGIDAGTTSVSGVLLNRDSGRVEHTVSTEHGAALPPDNAEVDIQDPQKFLDAIESIRAELIDKAESLRRTGRPGTIDDDDPPIRALSVTGQVHGILYIGDDGRHVSPLYTWQDTRGRCSAQARGESPSGSESWSDWATSASGYLLPPGYGFLTHIINQHEGRVPREAVGFTTILGYISMQLAGARRPKLETTDAHSLGLFDLQTQRFDRDAYRTLGIPEEFVPEVVSAETILGTTEEGVDVFAAVGDNQAGYIGSVQDPTREPLISIGTSAQLSVYSPNLPAPDARRGEHYGWTGQLEIRPFPGGDFLFAGSSITGGSSYRLLESLFREICRKYTGIDPGSLLEQMNSIPYDELQESLKLDVSTQFLGTRLDPSKRGSIRNISRGNFSHDYLVEGFLRGIVSELKTYFNDLPAHDRARTERVIGVGNALRRNPLLCRILEEEMNVPLYSPEYREEAALGAAIIAAVGAGAYQSYVSTDRPVSYEKAGTSKVSPDETS